MEALAASGYVAPLPEVSRVLDVAAVLRTAGFEAARMLAPDLPPLEEDLLWRLAVQVADVEARGERAAAERAMRTAFGQFG